MSDTLPIPITTPGAPEAQAQIHGVSNALKVLGAELGKVSNTGAPRTEQSVKALSNALHTTAETSSRAASGVRRDWGAIANSFNEIRDAVSTVTERVIGFGAAVVNRASEAERLARAQQQLGLSFEQAAQRAGGYVDTLQLATNAQTAAERGIRLHQDELNALTVVAQNYARTTGRDFHDVMENLIETVTEGGEELGKFDTALLRVSNQSQFTANDRLAALVVRARQIAPAANTAAESMQTLGGAITEAGRQAASGFVDGVRQLEVFRNVSSEVRSVFDDMKDSAYAFGGAIATVLGTIVNLGNVALTTLRAGATSIVQTIGALGELASSPRDWRNVLGRVERANQQGAQEAREAFAQLLRDAQGPRERTTVEDRAALPTLAGARRDRRARTQRPGASASGGQNAAESTSAAVALNRTIAQEERAEIERTNAVRLRGLELDRDFARTGAERLRLEERIREERIKGAQADQQVARGQVETVRAFAASVEAQLQRTRNLEQRRTLMEQLNALRNDELELQRRIEDRETDITRAQRERANEQRRVADLMRRPQGGNGTGTFADRLDAERTRRQQARAQRDVERAIDDRLASEQSFTDRLREQHSQRIDLTDEATSFVSTAYGTLTDSLIGYFEAIAEGSMTVGEALQSMLAEVLKTLAKEAFVKAAFYLAEGVASLVSYQYDRAGQAFAAAALYGAAGAAALAGGVALTPSSATSKNKATASGSAQAGERASPVSRERDGDKGGTTINVMFGGPMYGTGGVRQAAREIGGVLRAGVVQGGVQLNLAAGML